MKAFILLSSFVLSQVIGGLVKRESYPETTPGAHGGHGHDKNCCKEKKVGEVLYKLSKQVADDDLKQYNCLSGCIYKEDKKDPYGPSYCFASGDLPVVCVDNFHWCYQGKCGPAAWPSVFEGCGGKSQSPIDVPAVPAAGPATMPLAFKDYEKMRAARVKHTAADNLEQGGKDSRLNGHVANNGHTAVLAVTGDENNGILSGGPLTAEYRMLQLHFHWGSDDSLGSEHTIQGNSYPMEMHIVHIKVNTTIDDAVAQPDGLAVVGQMFEIAHSDNPELQPIIDTLVNIKKYDSEFDMTASPLKVSDLLPGSTPYANYLGSLTTPACNEAVNWLLFLDPIKISAGQMDKFRMLDDSHGEAIVDNFRPPQPLNGRTVTFYQ